MWKHVAANVLTLLVVGAVLVAGILHLGSQRWSGAGPLEQAAFFEVPRGASMAEVADGLAQAGIVSSASLFRIGADYAGREGDLKFGTYEIPARAAMPDVLDILTAGGASVSPITVTHLIRQQGPEVRVRERVPGREESVEVATWTPGEPQPAAFAEILAREVPLTWRVSVAPGLTSWEVVEGLKSVDFLEGGDMPVPPEGALAPDTYEVTPGGSREDLVARMRAAQERILSEAWAARAPGVPVATPEEALILASIVEKETGVAEERRRVAGVFANRLEQGMRLQTDPTVVYGITLGQGPLGRGLRRSELDASTPYNTYRIDGLPPTPIANPGAESIRAALDPLETEELFFVADGTGGHAFAVTLAEHNRNVAAWRAIEATQGAAEGETGVQTGE